MTYTISGDQLKQWQEDYEIPYEATCEEAIESFSRKFKLQEYDDLEKQTLIPMRYELANSGYTTIRTCIN